MIRRVLGRWIKNRMALGQSAADATDNEGPRARRIDRPYEFHEFAKDFRWNEG